MAISAEVVQIVSCSQAAMLVLEVFALSMPLAFPLCCIPRRLIPFQEPFPKISSVGLRQCFGQEALFALFGSGLMNAEVQFAWPGVLFEGCVPRVRLVFL